MIRRLIPFVFVAATFVSAGSLRRRRDSSDGSSISLPCPLQCSWQSSMSWAKAISFDAPTINMVPDPAIVNASDPFSIMCAIYQEFGQCLSKCDVTSDADRKAQAAVPSYDQICATRQADFDKASPCLTNNTSLFQSMCKSENEDLLAATARLQPISQLSVLDTKRYCDSANRQAYCIFPVVRQTCGDDSYNLIRSIANAPVTVIQAFAGNKIADMLPSCGIYFNTLANGISLTQTQTQTQTQTVSVSVPSTTTAVSTTTMATTLNTTTASPTTSARLRDDPIPYDKGMGLSGTNPPSTTPSGASKMNFSNLLAFFVFCMLFW